jgi:type I restriction enzyme, S subunit
MNKKELPPLPSGWSWTKIGEIAEVNPSMNYSSIDPNIEVSFVPMSAVDENSGTIMSPEIMSLEQARKGHTKFKEKDVIFARITPCMENGKIAIARNLKNGLGFGSTEFHVFRPRDKVLPEFIFYFLRQKSFRDFAASRMSSTVGQLRVPRHIIEDAYFPLAPADEQRRILNRINELFDLCKVAKEPINKIERNLKPFRMSVLKYAFEGKLTDKWRKDHKTIQPAAVLLQHFSRQMSGYPESFDESDLFILPDGWTWTDIDHIETFIGSGITPRGGKSVYVSNGIPFIRSQNIYPDGLHLEGIVYVTEELHKKMSRTHVQSGDVLLNITGASIGRSTFIPDNFGPANVNQHVCIIRTGPWINHKYLSYWLNSPFSQNIIFTTNAGVTRQGLNYSQIRSIPIPLPPLEEQKRILNKIVELFAFLHQIEKSVEELERRFNKIDESVLTNAFCGELVPQNPNDESALVILERIKTERKKGSEPSRFHDDLIQSTLN